MSVALQVSMRAEHATGRHGRAPWALASVEGRRLLRTPLVLAGAVASLAVFGKGTWSQAPVPQVDDALVVGTMLPFAVGVFLAANLVALRSRGHRTEELYEGMPVGRRERVLGHLLSVGWAAAAAAVLVGAQLLYLVAPRRRRTTQLLPFDQGVRQTPAMNNQGGRLGMGVAVSVQREGSPGVRVEQVTRRYGRTVALDHVDVEIGPGITGLLGPNGAGKTTLLSILATVASPDSGRLSVLGHDPDEASGRLAIRRSLGYLPQELGYHRQFKVAAFLDYVAILKEITDSRRRHTEVARVLAETGLEPVASKPIRALSGGMRRRVGLAQALLGDPSLLLLDEPASGLDPEQRLRFREMLSRLPVDRVVMLSTHQVDDVTAICSSVVVLLAGQVRFVGTPGELAEIAAGKVWEADARDGRAELSWRAGDGSWRHIGPQPPPGAHLVAATVEDGYLLLSGADGHSGDGDAEGRTIARGAP